ncbi:MAG: YdbH domain-containing protein, partial [Candidatus Omnitrophica bacterium]|nr:YdbH domain-containing protein [Candidatus Omnitrophota bacterium]
MKKVFLILLLIILLAVILINPAATFLLKKQLNTIFKGSEISIGSCHLSPAKQLSLFDVSIKNKKGYIFKREILKFSLNGADIYFNLPQKNIAEFSQYFNLGSKSAFLVKSFEVSDLNFILQAKDFNASGVFSSRVNLIERITEYLDIKIDSLGIQGFNLSGVILKASQSLSDGHFGINRMKYDKLNISDIKSQARLSGKELLLEGLSAKALDGDIGGNLKLKVDQDISYSAILKFIKLDISKFVNDFNLKDKFEMTGRLSGDLVFESKGAEIKVLNGKFSSPESGGMLIIKDTKFLENMAHNSSQPINLLMESFKNYHYNMGTIKLF